MTTKKILIVLVVMTSALLACSLQVSSPVMTVTPDPTATAVMTEAPEQATATDEWTATVSRAQINVRTEPDGDPTGKYLTAGNTVIIVRCVGDWCKISKPVAGWVWRGCLSDNPKNLGCEAR